MERSIQGLQILGDSEVIVKWSNDQNIICNVLLIPLLEEEKILKISRNQLVLTTFLDKGILEMIS